MLGKVFGQKVEVLMSKRYEFASLFAPFPRDPYGLDECIPKTRVVPCCMSLSLAPIESYVSYVCLWKTRDVTCFHDDYVYVCMFRIM